MKLPTMDRAQCSVKRSEDGTLRLFGFNDTIIFARKEVRRLFQKLSGDYRD